MNDYSLFDNEELFALAVFEFDKENYHTALPKLKKLVTDDTPPVGAFSVIARLYANLSLFEKAKVALETYLELQPEAVPEHFHLSMIHIELGNENKAIDIWEEVLEKAPNFPPVLFAKAQYLHREKQSELALDLLNQIILSASPQDQHVELANRLISEISLQS